jgi:hypothetical protein
MSRSRGPAKSAGVGGRSIRGPSPPAAGVAGPAAAVTRPRTRRHPSAAGSGTGRRADDHQEFDERKAVMSRRRSLHCRTSKVGIRGRGNRIRSGMRNGLRVRETRSLRAQPADERLRQPRGRFDSGGVDLTHPQAGKRVRRRRTLVPKMSIDSGEGGAIPAEPIVTVAGGSARSVATGFTIQIPFAGPVLPCGGAAGVTRPRRLLPPSSKGGS